MDSINNNADLYDFVLFGVIERISRFYRLVHDMKYENMDYYTGIVNDIDECLWIILAEVITTVKQDDCCNTAKIDNLLGACNKLKKLHLEIGCLPIMDQQIELLRFERLFRDGLKEKVPELSEFMIGFVETTNQQVHLGTPLSETKDNLLQQSFKDKTLSQDFDYMDPSDQTNNNPKSHITLPRIELKNPLAWSIIAHEISHRLIDHCFQDTNYFDDFKSYIKDKGIFFPCSLDEERIKHHILEYWCDFLGTLIIGGAFLFSQCDAMFFDGINTDTSNIHPPKYLRLWLIRQILVNRLTPNNYLTQNESFLRTFSSMQVLLREKSQIEENDRYISMQFLNYLLKKFIFRNESQEMQLASPLAKLLDYFKRDNFEAESIYIPDLVSSLSKGFPIPSYRVPLKGLEENCTTIQDILLAGFLYREEILKNTVISEFKNTIIEKSIIMEKSKSKENIDNFLQQTDRNLGVFDTCLLRSIQISEYVNLLKKNNQEEQNDKVKEHELVSNTTDNNQNEFKQLLNDEEIKNELIMRSINIIPLINKIQIGATSLDVRLGTSFQIYKPNHSGILDLVSDESLKETEKNSTFIDLEYLEGVVLAPGQFMLGHTMEYLILPNNIAAELEGRSSYARLGIEIHMTAGFVDPGFTGVLTLELFNAGPNPVKIYPGLRIGQLRFFRCTETKRPYNRNDFAKYKGLLRHNESLLMKDYEIACYRDELDKRRNKHNNEGDVNG
jgi:dCTP deaminase